MRSGEEALFECADGRSNWFRSKTGLVHQQREKAIQQQPDLADESNYSVNMKPILNGKTKLAPLNGGSFGNHFRTEGKIGIDSCIGLVNGKNRSTFNNTGVGVDQTTATTRNDNTITIWVTNSSPSASSSHNHVSNDGNASLCKESEKDDKCTKDGLQRRASPKRRKKEMSLSLSRSLSAKKSFSSKKKQVDQEYQDYHHHHQQEDLFHSYSFYYSCDDDESIVSDVKHLPSLTLSHRMIAQDVKMSDLRSQLISHKLLLTNLIKVKESEVRNLVKATKQHVRSEGLLEKPGRTHLDTILESKRTRISSKCSENYLSIRKGICCFENEVYTCDKPSLPFSRHCQRHILYNVDQLLFVRCTAKDSDTLTQCSNPSLDVLRDEPLCNHHWQVKNRAQLESEVDLEEQQQHHSNHGKGKGRNKPTTGAGRPGRKSKKRRRMAGKGGSGSIDSIDSSSFLSQDSSDSPFINSTTENNCDSTQVHHPSAIKINSNEITSPAQVGGDQVCISSPASRIPPSSVLHQHPLPSALPEQTVFGTLPIISTTTSSTTANTPTPPTLLPRNPLRLPQSTPLPPAPVVGPENHQPNGVIPGSLDVGVSTLAPSDEALVASLVAELPPLCTGSGPEPEAPSFVDADLTDVLNKIPDDAFNDLFVDNLKNGDIPSKEESEALEQALAAVSKNVHILSVAAAVVGSRTVTSPTPRTTGGTVINGDSNYYSHLQQHHHHHHHNHQQTQHHHHHHHTHHTVNGQAPSSAPLPSHDVQGRLNSSGPALNLNENDILGLANNILTSLTDEQQQQLNGLIDGALASGTLTSSPTLKSALASLSNLAQEGEPCETHL